MVAHPLIAKPGYNAGACQRPAMPQRPEPRVADSSLHGLRATSFRSPTALRQRRHPFASPSVREPEHNALRPQIGLLFDGVATVFDGDIVDRRRRRTRDHVEGEPQRKGQLKRTWPPRHVLNLRGSAGIRGDGGSPGAPSAVLRSIAGQVKGRLEELIRVRSPFRVQNPEGCAERRALVGCGGRATAAAVSSRALRRRPLRYGLFVGPEAAIGKDAISVGHGSGDEQGLRVSSVETCLRRVTCRPQGPSEESTLGAA